jgi:hypothetical protein
MNAITQALKKGNIHLPRHFLDTPSIALPIAPYPNETANPIIGGDLSQTLAEQQQP